MRWVRHTLFAILGGVLAIPGRGFADDEPPPPEEVEVPAPDAIAAPEIARRLEETFREIQAAAPRLRRDPAVHATGNQLPALRRMIEGAQQRPALDQLDDLSGPALLDLTHDWGRLRERVEAMQATLEARGTEIEEEREHMARAREQWEITRDAERDEPLPESQLRRIERLLSHVHRAEQRLDERAESVFGLQGQLSDLGMIVSSTAAQVASAQQRSRARRAERDHEPLWQGGDALASAPHHLTPASALAQIKRSTRRFWERHPGELATQLLLFLSLLLAFGWAHRRYGRRKPPSGPYASSSAGLRAVISHPVASALLLAVLPYPLLFDHLPFVVAIGIGVVAALATLPLLPYVGPRTDTKWWRALLLLAVLATPLSLGLTTAVVSRLVLTLLPLAAALCAGYLARPNQTIESDAARLGVRILPLVWLGAVYFNTMGFVEQSARLAQGAFATMIAIVAVPATISLLHGLWRPFARSPFMSRIRTLRDHRRLTTERITNLLKVGGWVLLAVISLSAFDVLSETTETIRLVMRKTFTFGTIEVSLGDIAGFVATVFGTFITVRLVHTMLSEELLPRLGMKKGAIAAVSLPVSYLLSAVGIVLAFGAAGLDPERLALLGGALGVGIGFGLQNVVRNFVSGLILAAERPIQVGDMIEMGSLLGEVSRIGVRSSTVHSLEGAEVIVPNSDLISGQLINWTHSDRRRRVDLAIGTGYQHDPAEVLPILLRAARSQPGILRDPAASVMCVGFGDSSIDFSVRVWTPDFASAVEIRSQLAQRVYAALGEADIEIPFPKRDVHLIQPENGTSDDDRPATQSSPTGATASLTHEP